MKKLSMKKLKKPKFMGTLVLAMSMVLALPSMASAHCDTLDGPTAVDGMKALETNNIKYAAKWVTPENEKELTKIFSLSEKVRKQSPEGKELADQYFLENLVRLHRAGEGAPFTGLKPSGTPIDERVAAADESIAVGNLSPLEGLMEEEKLPELKERFEKVMALKDYDENDLEAGREYVESYVKFFKFAEGEEDHAHGAVDPHAVPDEHTAEALAEVQDEHNEGSKTTLPWILSGVFFLTTVISIGHHFKTKNSN